MAPQQARGAARERPLRVLFVSEWALGHKTFMLNLQAHLRAYADLQVRWLYVDYDEFQRAATRRPWLRHRWSLWGSLQAVRKVLHAIPSGGADVLVFHTQTIAQLAWPLMCLVPTVVSLDATQIGLHSLAAAYDYTPPGDSPYDRTVRWMNRRVYHAASAMLPWSTWAADSLVADYGVDPAAIVVNPPGVDLSYWRPRAERQVDGPVKVLFVGGDFERKGGPLLLDVLQTIDALWELHLVTGAAVPSSERVWVHRGLTSNSPELAALYATCDVFALPTFGDCSPIATIEAAASGLPVLCTCIGGTADLVADGETGYLIPVGDAAALRDRLTTLLADSALRRRMGAAGRARAEAYFDARARAATVHRLIRAVHERRPGFAGESLGEALGARSARDSNVPMSVAMNTSAVGR
ncbi:MAG: glycosyltransferase family 4 protein [Chloroflexota bacterium]